MAWGPHQFHLSLYVLAIPHIKKWSLFFFSWNWTEFVIGFVQYNEVVVSYAVPITEPLKRFEDFSPFLLGANHHVRSLTTLRPSRCEQTEATHMERPNKEGDMLILSKFSMLSFRDNSHRCGGAILDFLVLQAIMWSKEMTYPGPAQRLES